MSVDHDEPGPVGVTLPADANQVDQTGHVWTYLDGSPEPDRVRPGRLIVSGDEAEPFLARVLDVGTGERAIVHLEVVGEPRQLIEELERTGLLDRR